MHITEEHLKEHEWIHSRVLVPIPVCYACLVRSAGIDFLSDSALTFPLSTFSDS